ncbi:MAG: redoxin domain-containing protein [Gammaproteobacteria bacterium]|nr:redoxin domain-containing protein [Gammaproteobacteria bacterium]
MSRLNIRPVWFLIVLLAGAVSVLVYNSFYQKGLQQAAQRVASGGGAGAASALIGTRRPDFALPDLDGLPRKVGEWDGKVLVVNFWADNCRPCRREIPAFIRMQGDFLKRGVQFVGIAINERDAVRTFAAEMGVEFNYPVLTGVDDTIEVARNFGNEVGILPYTVVVDRSGKISEVQFGEVREDELRGMLSPLL